MSTEWVVTLVDPVDKLREMYENEVLSKFKDQLKAKEEEANASKSSDTNKPQQISISDR